ncbi:MAG: DNA internalization-related competence protein ComEC/Rec2 [Aerococcus sp.]|nr:DNA internalization-related competence protein ComEC/Rec2 [Aerococcus sp.]
MADRSLRRRYFVLQGVGILLIGLFFLWYRTQLTAGEATLRLFVPATDIQVQGDQLSLKGYLIHGRWQEQLPIFFRIKSKGEQANWLHQTHSLIIQVRGEVKLPDARTNFGVFDYRQYLYSHNIHWLIQAKQLTIAGPATGIRAFIANTARQLHDSFDTLAVPEVRDYLQSLFFNDKQALDADVLTHYQVIGLIHLFSISGFHVNLLVRLLKQICLRVGMLKEHFEWFTLVILLLYGTVLGWPYGMIRALGDYGLPKVCIYRPKNRFETTSISLLLILVCYPLAIFSLSFQLSYALSFLLRYLSQRPTKHSPWLSGICLSFQCVLVAIPFLVYQYHEFSWVTVLFGQLFAGIFTLCLMPLLLVIMGAHWLGISGWFILLQRVVSWIIQRIEWLSETLAHWHLLQWRVGTPGRLIIGLLVLAILYYFQCQLTRQHRSRSYWGLALALMLLWSAPYLDPLGQVATLDVGQGDTHYIELPHQRGTYLIDACETIQYQQSAWQKRPHKTVASRQIIPSLKAEGCRTLDGIFITHADQDHIGALVEIMQTIPTKRLYLPIGMQASEKGQQIVKEAFMKSCYQKTELIWLSAGETYQLKGKTAVTVLSPDAIGTGKNEDSLVLYGQFGPQTFLFTGDLVGPNEEKVAERLNKKHWPVDILKVAHHGSDHSSATDWLERVHPKCAFISVGRKNRYGHPGKRVIEDLKQQHIAIYRTDQQGAIHYYYFHGRWWIKTVQ